MSHILCVCGRLWNSTFCQTFVAWFITRRYILLTTQILSSILLRNEWEWTRAMIFDRRKRKKETKESNSLPSITWLKESTSHWPVADIVYTLVWLTTLAVHTHWYSPVISWCTSLKTQRIRWLMWVWDIKEVMRADVCQRGTVINTRGRWLPGHGVDLG